MSGGEKAGKNKLRRNWLFSGLSWLILHRGSEALAVVFGKTGRREKVDRKGSVQRLVGKSVVDIDFYFLLLLATLVSTLGLLFDNTMVVVGGGLVSPMLTPVLALGLGIVTFNRESLVRSATTIIRSTLFILSVSLLTTVVLGSAEQTSLVLLRRVSFSMPFLYISVLSGVIAAYSWVKPQYSVNLLGVAMAVAILPPLCASGIGLALFNWPVVVLAMSLFVVNVLGIAVASAVVFSVFGFHQMKEVERSAISKAQKTKT